MEVSILINTFRFQLLSYYTRSIAIIHVFPLLHILKEEGSITIVLTSVPWYKDKAEIVSIRNYRWLVDFLEHGILYGNPQPWSKNAPNVRLQVTLSYLGFWSIFYRNLWLFKIFLNALAEVLLTGSYNKLKIKFIWVLNPLGFIVFIRYKFQKFILDLH